MEDRGRRPHVERGGVIKVDPVRLKKAMDLMDDEMKAMMKVHARLSIEDEAKKRFSKTYPEK